MSDLVPGNAPLSALLEEMDFMDQVEQLPTSIQRMVAELLKRVVMVEDEMGEDAALALIDDVSCILLRGETTH